MIDQPLTLPCGQTLANRFCKSAMTEGLASRAGLATTAHQRCTPPGHRVAQRC